jgi:cobalt-zinc-cadmium resistance protein CzcA
MISKIIDFSVDNKFVIALLVVIMATAGVYSMLNIPIDAVPDITNNQVQVVTTSPSLAPQEVEQFITYPLEISMANIPNVNEIRSISKFGLSIITIVFEDDVPILEARQFVKEQIGIAQNEIDENLGTPEMMPISTGLGEIYQYSLKVAPEYKSIYDVMKLRTIQDWIVKRQLAGIKGIIEVSSFGGLVKQYEVAVNPKKLKAFDLTINDVFEALEKNNQNSGGSYIEQETNAYYIRMEGLLNNFDDIGNVVVAQRNGVPILVKHLGEIHFSSPPRFGAMTMDGEGETVGGITMMFKDANSSEAIENVHKRITEIQKSLPKGVTIEPFLDRSVLVNKTIKTVAKNLLEGGVVVVVVLVLLLGNLRAALLVASVIPLAMLFAFILMRYFGVSANLMSLGAIDFGIVIDGAVIVVEGVLYSIYASHLGKKLSQPEMDGVIKKTASSLIKSAAFGVLIILVVFVPIMTLTGIEGKMFRPMAQAVSFAILGALILSITYVPMMAALFLNKNIKEHTSFADKIVNALRSAYKPFLLLALKFQKGIIVLVLTLFGIAIWLFSMMGSEFIPKLVEGDLAMLMMIKPGSSLTQMVKMTSEAEKIVLDNFPEVLHVVSKIGTAEIPTDPMSVEDADIMIILKKREEWTSASNPDDLATQMKEKLEVLKGASFEFSQPIQLRFNELISGDKADVSVKIFGEDLSELAQKAEQAGKIIQKIQGAGDVKVEQTEGLPQKMIRFDRQKMAFHGLDIATLNQIIRSAYAGQVTGVVYEGERKFDLVVRLGIENRQEVNLSKLFIKTPQGVILPLSQVARVDEEEAPVKISREDAKRRVSIGINVRNRDIASFVAEVEQKLASDLKLKAGYHIRYGGQFENLQSAKKRLYVAVPVSLFLIFVLLFFAFDEFKYATMIYATVPLATIGGIAALLVRGMPFSISAGIGFMALFGVAVLNGIVLISYFNQLKKEREFSSLKELIIEGTLTRFRPVIMTAAVASLGFMPMALSTSAGAEIQKPLATVVIGGLISSTLLTLFVLPIIYYLIEKGSFITKNGKKED